MAARTLEEIRIENEVAERQRARDRETIKAERDARLATEKLAADASRAAAEEKVKADYRARFAGSDEQFNDEVWPTLRQQLQVDSTLNGPTRPRWAPDAAKIF